MEPDEPGRTLPDSLRADEAQPLQQSFAVLVRRGHAIEPPGRAQRQRRQQKQIVQKSDSQEHNNSILLPDANDTDAHQMVLS